jgi:hypothetical protein
VRIAVIACVMLVISSARAETLTERASRLFDEGWSLKEKGEIAKACDRFAESYQLVAARGTGLNLAECMEQQGHLLRAWQLYTDAIVEWERTGEDKRAAYARERAHALEAKLVKLVITIDDPKLDQLTVTIGTRNVKPARKIRELADPGEIDVRAVAPGRIPVVQTLQAEAGATRTLHIALQPIANSTDSPSLVETHRRRSRVALAIGMGALGVGGVVTGTVLFFNARTLQADGETNRAEHQADLATGFGAGGAIFLAAAVFVFATAPRDVTVTPVAGSTSVGVSVGRSF